MIESHDLSNDQSHDLSHDQSHDLSHDHHSFMQSCLALTSVVRRVRRKKTSATATPTAEDKRDELQQLVLNHTRQVLER